MLTLPLQTLAITVTTALCTLVPFTAFKDRALPRGLLPLATGTMMGLCLFGLLPEAGKEGGALSLGLTIVVAGIYSLVHLRHLHHHAQPDSSTPHGPHDHHHAKPLAILLAAIFVHSLLDGSLLVMSGDVFNHAATPVTLSLGIHKAFEALSLASLVYWRLPNRKVAARWLGAYVLSFPCGVFLTAWVQQQFSLAVMQRLALVVMSIAIGNLIGCLIFDFVMPAVQRFKQHRDEFYWLLGGMAAASVLLWQM